MPDLLGFAKVSVGELVKRIEDRSILLIQSGQMVKDGVLRPVYEFKHLTFQEYLAAVALTHGYFKDADDAGELDELVEPHLAETAWKEGHSACRCLGGKTSWPSR